MGRKRVGATRATEDALATLGVTLRKQRAARQVTIAELAARSGVSPRTVSAIEAGSPATSIGNVLNL